LRGKKSGSRVSVTIFLVFFLSFFFVLSWICDRFFEGVDTAATMAGYEGDDSGDEEEEEESGDDASGPDSMSDDDSDDTVTKIAANNPFAVLDDR
jgi:hypothetical protein